jgi:Holliday junction resolvasome RuvABC endonuclease subunit
VYASARLRSDVNFCIECAKKNQGSIAYFLGEAKDLFEKYHNDIVAVEQVYTQQQAEKEQQQANAALLAKLSTGEMTISTNKLFKRRLDV